jgi:hypothetical protein
MVGIEANFLNTQALIPNLPSHKQTQGRESFSLVVLPTPASKHHRSLTDAKLLQGEMSI